MRRLATLLLALLCFSALCAASYAGSESASTPTRIAFSPGGLGVMPGDVGILSSHVYDYTFADAPADWTPRGGLWTTTNRWTCSPQWSWYGGHNANGIAAIWNKHEFVGDVTVEAYLAFKMGVGVVYQSRSYKNPANMCLTIAGDGADPASGYSFIIGAEKNTVTRIMKGTKVLAQTTDTKYLLPIFEDRFPSTDEWHHKWWGVRARQKGDLLQLYLDDKLVLEAHDPQPLSGGHVGVWTVDNGLLMPRIKIYYTAEKIGRDAIPGDDIQLPELPEALPAIALTSSTHPSVQNDFETSGGTFKNTTGDKGASLSLVSPGADGKGHCLALWHKIPGGDAGASMLKDRFDVREMPFLSFDYKLPADAKVNLYLTVSDRRCEIVFSGLKTPAPLCTIIGEVPGVLADGKWHHAQFNLLGALEAAFGPDAILQARDLFIGNLNDADYLQAGFGGNHAGLIYYIDNFFLGKPAGKSIKMAVQPTGAVSGYGVSIDRDPYGSAPQQVTFKENAFALNAKEDGTWYVHVRPQTTGGKWGDSQTYLIHVESAALKIASTSPKTGDKVMSSPICITFSKPGVSFIDGASVQMKVNGTALALGKPGVNFDAQENTFRIEPGLAGLTFKDGQSVAVDVAAATDTAGNKLAAPAQLAFKASLAGDKTVPSAPKLTLPKYAANLTNDDFESDIGEWTSYGASDSADLSIDPTTAPPGSKSSLRIYNCDEGSRFGVYVRRRNSPFDAGKYRYVSFDYKVPSRLRADLALYVNGEWKAIKFKDNDDNLTMIGEVPNVIDDNEWHHADLDLYDMLRKNDPGAASYMVGNFVIADWGWTSNAQGQTYHIGNFHIAPIVSGAQPLTVKWSASDAAGVTGISYVLDESSATIPPQKVNATGSEFQVQATGDKRMWLHARAVDSAGNWGPATHVALHFSTSVPVAQSVSPEAGAKTATAQIAIKLAGVGLAGLDPASLRLSIAGTEYTVDSTALTYNADTHVIAWNGEEDTPQPVVFKDGQAVAVKVVAAKDYAGNAVAQAPEWSWTMDYSKDKTPPVVKVVRSTTHRTALTNTFTDGLGMWQNRGGELGAAVSLDPKGGPTGGPCVKLVQQRDGGHMQALITNQPYSAEINPIISFDYKYQPNVKLDLLAYSEGNWYAIALSDDPAGAVGRVSGFAADGQWHHANIDIGSVIKRQNPRGSLVIDYLILSDRNKLENPAGATAWFGDFVIGRVGRSEPVFHWEATDATGITGYSYVFDQNPATVPPEQVTPLENADKAAVPTNAMKYEKATPGVWYFHIRARDGAGNWGPTRTYAALHMNVE